MLKFILFCLEIFFLVFIILILGFFLTIKISQDLKKKRPFECGFSPRFDRRVPFSLQFFLVALIFVIFDIELVLIYPFLLFSKIYFSLINFFIFILFLILLTLGLLLE